MLNLTLTWLIVKDLSELTPAMMKKWVEFDTGDTPMNC